MNLHFVIFTDRQIEIERERERERERTHTHIHTHTQTQDYSQQVGVNLLTGLW